MNVKSKLLAALAAAALVIGAPPVRAGDTPHIEIQFVKWVTSYPAMAGQATGDVVGDYVGVVLNREVLAGGNVVKLEALYGILAGERSFVAHIAGTWTIQNDHAVLNGEIVEGWLKGARVHVEFSSVQFEEHPVCWEGTIRISPSATE